MTPHRSHQYHLITLTTFVPLHLRTITPPSPSSLPPRGSENTTKVMFGWVDITTAAPQGVVLVANFLDILKHGKFATRIDENGKRYVTCPAGTRNTVQALLGSDIHGQYFMVSDECSFKQRLKGTGTEGGFERAFASLFDQDVQTFTGTMLLNLDQLEKQLDKEEFQEIGSFDAFRVLMTQFQTFINSPFLFDNDDDIKLVYNEELRAEVQLTVEHNVLANEQQHTMQSEPIYDTYMLEKVDSNTTLDSTNMTTPHYLPKVREYVLAKPHHVIAHGSSRNSHEESYGSNDMAPNHYLEEERKKTQERNRNLKSSVMHTTSLQNTTNGSKQKSRSNSQTSRSLPVSKSSGVTSNSIPLVDHSRNSSSFSDSKYFVFSTCPSPQPQPLGTTFEGRVRDYIIAHTEIIERFENAIFKQHEEINDRMTEMFGLLKELTTSRTPKKVLIREEAKVPVTKNVNSISLARGEEERNDKTDETLDNTVKPTGTETGIRHRINEKLIEGLVDNNRLNDSLSRTLVGKVKGKTYNVLPRGPVYEAIQKKKITKKEDIRGNFEIPCSIGGLKHVNALVDQGSNVNIMPYSTYMKLTNERPAETDIKLSLASHSYIYPLGIVEDVLVEIKQYNSLSNLEKEYTKLVYLRNEEDKRRGVEYVMSKILGFYKECLELVSEYATGMDDEGEVTKFLIKNEEEFFTVPGDGVRIKPDGVASPAM
ncbi:MAK10-like protein [Tanacetum coccineum]